MADQAPDAPASDTADEGLPVFELADEFAPSPAGDAPRRPARDAEVVDFEALVAQALDNAGFVPASPAPRGPPDTAPIPAHRPPRPASSPLRGVSSVGRAIASAEASGHTPAEAQEAGDPGSRREDDGAQIARQAKVIDAMRRKLRQLGVETETYKKRIASEAQGARMEGRADVFRSLLPVIDALELALVSARARGKDERIAHGLHLLLKQLRDALGRLGLEAVVATRVAFDPTQHEAFQHIHTGEAAPGEIVRVARTGYRFNDRLLRAAQVVVEAPD